MGYLNKWLSVSGVDSSSSANPAAKRRSRVPAAALLGLSLSVASLGGGAVGATLATRGLDPAQGASIVTPRPIAQVATTDVASAVLRAVGPSVVEVTTAGQAGRRQLGPSGSGSGVVVDTTGLILTKQHVVAGASTVTVQFSTGEERSATMLGSDRTNDLAPDRVRFGTMGSVAACGQMERSRLCFGLLT